MRKYSSVPRQRETILGGMMQVFSFTSTNERGSEELGVDHDVEDVRENLELRGHPDVVAVRRTARS
jgi:hypothetical protein